MGGVHGARHVDRILPVGMTVAMWMVWSLALLMTGIGMWGQYWYDKAHRQADAIAFMIEEEIDSEVP